MRAMYTNPKSAEENLLLRLTLMLIPGIRRRTVHRAVSQGEFAGAGSGELYDLLRRLRILNPRVPLPAPGDIEDAWCRAGNILVDAARVGVSLSAPGHEDFPPRLAATDDPPAVLFYRGNLRCSAEKMAVAVVGTRCPTRFGEKVAYATGAVLAWAGVVVVSGLALGCDAAGHRGSVEAGGQTVAVLPCGPDLVYPRQNRLLAARILEGGGCLLGEYPPGTRPERAHFIERDRLQSGLGSGLVVIETDLGGGTMHAVRHALRNGRPVACLDHPPAWHTRPQARGNRALLDLGEASPIRGQADLEAFLETCRSAGKP